MSHDINERIRELLTVRFNNIVYQKIPWCRRRFNF